MAAESGSGRKPAGGMGKENGEMEVFI